MEWIGFPAKTLSIVAINFDQQKCNMKAII